MAWLEYVTLATWARAGNNRLHSGLVIRLRAGLGVNRRGGLVNRRSGLVDRESGLVNRRSRLVPGRVRAERG